MWPPPSLRFSAQLRWEINKETQEDNFSSIPIFQPHQKCFFIKLFSITNKCNILPNGLFQQCFGPIASFVPLLSFSVMFCSLLNGKWCDILPRGFPSNWSKRPTIFFYLSPVFHLCRNLSHHVFSSIFLKCLSQGLILLLSEQSSLFRGWNVPNQFLDINDTDICRIFLWYLYLFWNNFFWNDPQWKYMYGLIFMRNQCDHLLPRGSLPNW